MKIFISSVQKEFATERKALAAYLAGDPLLRRFFECFLFEDRITRFLGLARRGRNFPLPGDTPPHEVLAHLNLLDKGRPTHAAILLFGKQPQRFLITSEVKCAHFHGYEVAEPMYLTKYIERMGTGILDMIRRCKKAGLAEPEIRLDGGFFVLTIRRKKSEPGVQAGTMPAPGRDQVIPQVTPQVTPQVRALLGAIVDAPLSRGELQETVGIKDREHFRKAYLEPLLTVDWIERTIPDKPTSSLQKYRLTEKGRSLLEQLNKEKGRP